ncbi:hypothetical protein J7T55_002526 [Diaporthe amygdali]|uniref:uncharacterized protein n=1 Tax=Phomopsis amygdali TaxID=1214568 RepID=UPI0022FF1BD4|nr:uncharacterized protein J7T55_002526 [Diaporthe amygdali]KAJ0122015.1 hypothetical protein J7T55_002526 [Diaporthe amygdali]
MDMVQYSLKSSMLAHSCLQEVLKNTAKFKPNGNIIIYRLGNKHDPLRATYSHLYTQAFKNSLLLREVANFRPGDPILLCLYDHWDAMLWFWSVLLADGLPVQCPPAILSNGGESRHTFVDNISTLLDTPICIIREEELESFRGLHGLSLHTVESFSLRHASPLEPLRDLTGAKSIDWTAETDSHLHEDATAMLMLTSGSTDSPKAVCLTHRQVLSAVNGKASIRPGRTGPFLNWVGLDHVASLVEIHIQALWLGADQVHVHAADVVASPRSFLDLIDRHRVVTSFAPNFFLAKMVSDCGFSQHTGKQQTWDLSCLRLLASGGEANDMDTCAAVSRILSKYGAPNNVVVPGFGMTETCAGAIFNVKCPDYDTQYGYPFASLGRAMPGIEMRVVHETDASTSAKSSEHLGELQIHGPVVFKEYYRNPEATSKAFTADGWFRTGDQGIVDQQGHLRLMGRSKDVININGVKIGATAVQSALEKALRSLVARVVIFPARLIGSHTERIIVAYIPRLQHAADPIIVHNFAVEAALVCSGSTPMVFALPSEGYVGRTSLGKVSRNEMRALFEAGTFDDFVRQHQEAVQRCLITQEHPKLTTRRETFLLNKVVEVLGSSQTGTLTVDTPLIEAGCTSMDLIRMKRLIDEILGTNIPIITFIRNPTFRKLALALEHHNGHPETAYDPVVTFQEEGNKIPLWLIHPGVGEVLVFVGLAQQLSCDDRPIYALRARGFEPGQTSFASIAEAVSMYHSAIKRIQPTGPYAIAGYSYGAMLAFETVKALNSAGDDVRFLASFNLPPHIGARMQQLSWPLCFLHLCYFLGLHSEDYVEQIESAGVVSNMTKREAKESLFRSVDKGRLSELSQDEQSLSAWTDVAYGLQRMATQYKPTGMVSVLDVFHAIPLKSAAPSRDVWIKDQLSKWQDFCETNVQFHSVGGSHYTMISPDHVARFAKTLRSVMESRGI